MLNVSAMVARVVLVGICVVAGMFASSAGFLDKVPAPLLWVALPGGVALLYDGARRRKRELAALEVQRTAIGESIEREATAWFSDRGSGRLYLTPTRLVFVPRHATERSGWFELPREHLRDADRTDGRRILLSTKGRSYRLFVWDIDGWLDVLQCAAEQACHVALHESPAPSIRDTP